jgi:hypothetical protein
MSIRRSPTMDMLEAVHMLVRIDNRILPVQSGRRCLDCVGLAVFHHSLEYFHLFGRQLSLGKGLAPAFDMGFHGFYFSIVAFLM